MTDPDEELAAYDVYRKQHPELFVNPPDAAFEIIFEPDVQRAVNAGIVYRDGYYLLMRDAVRFRNGSVGPYIRLIHTAGSGGAAALPLVDGKVVLIRHQRHATRASHWEIPRGFARPGEDPLETARREVEEELGVSDPELQELGSVHPDTGASNGWTKLYLARIKRIGRIESDEGIDETRQVTADQLYSMVRAGEITDSFTLAAVLQARIRGIFE
jgi:ADP-ribose pyrophosphatase